MGGGGKERGQETDFRQLLCCFGDCSEVVMTETKFGPTDEHGRCRCHPFSDYSRSFYIGYYA